MVNSHYIPQFILRHFCVDNNIQYCDIEKRRVEKRTTRTVFSEQGYYPDKLEHELCVKIESQFANILNNKITKERYRIFLNADEMLLLKKYLMISILRYRTDELEKDPILQGLSKEQLEYLGGDFCENINKILVCKTKEDAFKYCNFESSDTNMTLMAYVKDVLCSYTVFVKTNNCGEDFILPDRGWGTYEGPIHIKKLTSTLELAMKTGDPLLFRIAEMITPHDYSIFPLTRNMAVMTVSIFFKLCMPDFPYNVIFPEEAPTLSQALGFGNAKTITPPVPRKVYGKGTEYLCEIQQLSKHDTVFLNSLLLSNADNYFAYAECERVKRSLESEGSYIFAINDNPRGF